MWPKNEGIGVVPLDWIVTGIEKVIVKFHEVDEATGGFISGIIVLAGAGVGILATAAAIAKVVEIVKALNVAGLAYNAILAVRDALSGPAGWVALGVASVVAAGVGYNYLNNKNSDGTGNNAGNATSDAVDRFADHVDRFGAAVNTLQSWSQVAGDQVPQGFTPQAFAWLKEQEINGAVG